MVGSWHITSCPICRSCDGRCWFLVGNDCSAPIPSCLCAAFDIGNCDLADLCCNIYIGDLDVVTIGVL